MKSQKLLKAIGATLILGLSAVSTNSRAMIVLDDWQIDLSAVAGEGLTGVLGPIDFIGYTGLFRSTLDVTGGADPLGIDAGDLGNVVFVVRATEISGNGSPKNVSTTGEQLATDFEITVVGTVQTVINPDGVSFTNTGVGTLDIYIDGTPDSSTAIDGTGGTGFDNGQLVASFSVMAGDGGSFNAATFDGSADATFVLTSVDAGVLLDSLGNDVALGTTIAITDANTDASPGGIPGGSMTTAAGTPVAGCGGQLGLDFCGTEDGSLSLAVLSVPEPGILALLGAGLLFVGGVRRRK